ncbi:hypothetical protein HG536_0B06200 [Torulaspora globosa]|uniref:Isocitrate lyase n=1 Tax=Torulaspora globosa TaxID=48254 RepID=A0A7G3ZE18_9SACH|nr:uncharacterized protein HG536_0B06200 [Torulaspora globosa]QLL31754.1 hypothetical protein HG536_0B06200 [Torulaspora globosa]
MGCGNRSTKLARNFCSKNLQQILKQEVQKVNEWWATPRFRNIQRTYTAEDVVKHRGSLPVQASQYLSSYQAQKLFQLLDEKFKSKSPVHTLGVIDPVQMSQLARCKDIRVAYVSGWACSSTLVGSTNEVSPDFGDYPYDTVPNQVERIFKAQQMHDRKLHLARLQQKGKAAADETDYLKPIIADADMGHGGVTTVMKVAKLFAEKGAAGIHLEDQLVGGKKCGHLSGAVIVPTSTHVSRLIATRFQWDLMGTENLAIARTDSCNAGLISSSTDPRDHQYIKGVIKPYTTAWSEQLVDLERESTVANRHILGDAETEWYAQNETMTFDEAVERQLSGNEYQAYHRMKAERMQQQKRNYLSLLEMKAIASMAAPNKEVIFDWDKPRTMEGHYMYHGCMEAAIQRSQIFAPYSDMLWLETKIPDQLQARSFADRIHEQYPEAKLVYNLSPSFNWSAHGYTPDSLQSFIWDIARYGFVLQLVSLAGVHVDGLSFWQLAKKFQETGMRAYVDQVQKIEKVENCDLLTHQKWSGVEYVDSLTKVVQNGSSAHTSSTGGDSFTESQF